ncbi:MAG: response regulator, partial [bacterium]|nr:response regulator [bacterium]
MNSPTEAMGRVLVVHDDPALLGRVVEAIERLEGQAVRATSVAEAVRQASAMPAFTAVLLSADLLLNSNPGVRESLSTVQTAA